MPISSGNNSVNVVPRFVSEDLLTASRLVNALNKNGCYRVPSSHIEQMLDEFRYYSRYGCSVGPNHKYEPRVDRTLYSVEVETDPGSISTYVFRQPEEYVHILISNIDGRVFEIEMHNNHIKSAVIKYIPYSAKEINNPSEIASFLDEYVMPNVWKTFDVWKEPWYDRKRIPPSWIF